MEFSRRLRDTLARRARSVRALTSLWARYRRYQYNRRINGFLRDKSCN